MSTSTTTPADEQTETTANDDAQDGGASPQVAPSDTDLTEISGVGGSKAEALIEEGFTSVADVREASVEALTAVDGVSETRAQSFKDSIEESDEDADDSPADADNTSDESEADNAEDNSDEALNDDESGDSEDSEADDDEEADSQHSSSETGPIGGHDAVPKAEGSPGLFEAAIEQSYLVSLFKRIKVHGDECKLHVNEEGVRAVIVDPANVSMGDQDLGARAFERLDADGGILGINVDRILEVLDLADSSSDLVQLSLDPATRKLKVAIEGLEATLALIDPDSIRTEPELPDLQLPTEADLEMEPLKRGLSAADMVSDHVKVSSDPEAEAVFIEAEGDTDEVSHTIGDDDYNALVTGHEANTSIFSLDYLKDMKKPIDGSTEVTIKFGSEFPLLMHHEFADGHGRCDMMVAPRIQGD
ncbi:DNA polymerase III sliding clamp (beta) subunit, PCNA homolog [Halorientalis persicus]|uniref:DNA polymerase sliding clamp n=1 Tax=Halorientalis persicus TaxID=1367881 RepID=A0A1H8W6M7_9EURY|nr:DNA polymerase sliding clamp [Halorientalis persicus]SEP23316.1 DNA polymerase III sliding clamp (beta) subunit, PCNA homolog [Halorientalis persicus]